ncbi:MAG: benzoate-CoA ligase family protein [Sutterellaceae bacterium]|nr:benzoate-CoA ligase family protein [Burkholderiaceae bacterium]MDW8429929.1 benzoate-CoA ligase family protein [Sutterellaceae bacterium]
MQAPPERFNFAQHLLAFNATRASKLAYLDDRRRLTYGELADRVRRLAGALQALGIRREERILLLMHDTCDWPVVFLGALYAGVVPVAVNTLLKDVDYAFMLEHCRAQAAFVSAPLLPTLQAAMQRSAHELRHLVVAGGSSADTQDLEVLLASSTPALQPAATGADEPAFWLYSSGSTGRPKGTVHTHANLYWTAELYGKPVLGLREDDLCFSAAKLFFAYGLGNALTFPLSVGASVLLMAERPTPEAVFKRWIEHKPTVFFGAPTGYAAMLVSPQLPAREQVALRLCSSAGEALPREIGERFTRHFGVPIIDGIGSTEMLHIFISNRPHDVRYGTSGKPVDGYRVQLRDEQGQVIEGANEVGDLYVEGPSAALMYWGNRAKSRETFQGVWTRTGDKYYRDADGYYVYAGRSDDMLKVSGQYVSPFEVEATLLEHQAVLEAAVIGVTDENGLTRPKAYVVLKNPAQASEALAQELQRFVKERLAPHKYPRIVEFLPELPKTATGKIQRFRLREREAGR